MIKALLKGRQGGLLALGLIALLVFGGLGWATRAALRLEQEQLHQQAVNDRKERIRLALTRLDSRISAILAREDSRPFIHYSAIFAPTLALDGSGACWMPGSVIEPSPLLQAALPSWMMLHFQTDSRGWESPQVLSPRLKSILAKSGVNVPLTNATEMRKELLAELIKELPPKELISSARKHAGSPVIQDRVLLAKLMAEQMNNYMQIDGKENSGVKDFYSRSGGQSKLQYPNLRNPERVAKDVALLNSIRNGEEWLHNWTTNGAQLLNTNQLQLNSPIQPNASSSQSRTYTNQTVGGRGSGPVRSITPSAEVLVNLSPMKCVWLSTRKNTQRMIVFRLVHLEEKEVCQGIVLNGDELRELLAEEVQDLVPGAEIIPAMQSTTEEEISRTMSTLPLRIQLEEVLVADDPGWSGLRLGLLLAWIAAGIALLAVGLVGWSLLDLSERRMRFVSAVTHELRTPLTTLRLYLDMLLGGMVRGEEQRTNYLRTLDAETDRLARLVGNVLDFSRLENQRPQLNFTTINPEELMAQLQATWETRCQVAGKKLLIDLQTPVDFTFDSDMGLLIQVIGNLLDNAIKYSRTAEDDRIWLRCSTTAGQLTIAVEDRGPGVPATEQRSIFRPFTRGHDFATTTGGVGLGLSLARQWTEFMGGKLSLVSPSTGGACFQVTFTARRVNGAIGM